MFTKHVDRVIEAVEIRSNCYGLTVSMSLCVTKPHGPTDIQSVLSLDQQMDESLLTLFMIRLKWIRPRRVISSTSFS